MQSHLERTWLTMWNVNQTDDEDDDVWCINKFRM